MSSFYAELVVAGHTYPVRRCEFGFAQATDARGRVQAKVRRGLLHLTRDVPDDDQLLAWAAWAQAAHKPQAGHVTFFETSQRTASEMVSFAAEPCVSYDEIFELSNANNGLFLPAVTLSHPLLAQVPHTAN